MTSIASKTWDMLRLIRHGGPALCNIAVTNSCNAACDFCNFARGKVASRDLRWIDADQFDRERWPLARASNVPVCTGPSKALTPSLLSATQNSVVAFKTFGSADQNARPHDPSLSWGAPGHIPGAIHAPDQELVLEEKGLRNYGTDAARTEQAGQGSNEMDKKNDQIAHRRIVAGREILRKYGRNNNSPATPVTWYLSRSIEAVVTCRAVEFIVLL
jgi:hypothetical protein